MAKIFASKSLILAEIFLLLICACLQSMTEEQIDPICPKPDEPMIDLTYFLYTGSSLSNQSFIDLKQFVIDISEYFYMTANSKKGMRFYGVSYAGSDEFQLAFYQKYSRRMIVEAVPHIRKMKSEKNDLNQAVKELTENHLHHFRSTDEFEYMGKSAIIITNTAMDEASMVELKTSLMFYDVVLCIGIVEHDNVTIRKQLGALANRYEDSGLLSMYIFKSYADLRESNKEHFVPKICTWIRAPSPCVPPEAPQHGHVSFDSTRVNSIAFYTCSEGYSSTLPVRICTRYSTWNGTESLCKPACNMPVAAEHGKLTYENVFVNSTVTFTCEHGYEVDLNTSTASVTSKCMPSLHWSSGFPKCRKSTESQIIGPLSPWEMMRHLTNESGNGTHGPRSSNDLGHMKFHLEAGMNVRPTEAEHETDEGYLAYLSVVEAGIIAVILVMIGAAAYVKLRKKPEARADNASVAGS